MLCATCASSPASETIVCESLDCPWMYARTKAFRKLDSVKDIQDLIKRFPGLSIKEQEVIDLDVTLDDTIIDLTEFD